MAKIDFLEWTQYLIFEYKKAQGLISEPFLL